MINHVSLKSYLLIISLQLTKDKLKLQVINMFTT